jgi:hypothetical protein
MKGTVRGLAPLVACLIVLAAVGQAWAAAWEIQASQNLSTTYNFLTAVGTASSTDAWADGFYKNSSGNCRTLLEHYDGSSWTEVGSPNPSGANDYLYGFKLTSSTNAWAVGSDGDAVASKTLIVHYDGASWSLQTGKNPSSQLNVLAAVGATSASNAWAVGSRGAQSPFDDCQQLGGSDIRASLSDRPRAGATDTLIEHYDGTSWTVQKSPSPGACENFLYGASATSTSDAWAAGWYKNGCAAAAKTLVEHYDGTKWVRLPSPNLGNGGDGFYSISADDPSDVWAVGTYFVGTVQFGFIARYNGTSWKTWKVKHGTANALFGVKATSPTNVWAVGAYVNGPEFVQILHYDGTSWKFQTANGDPGQSELEAVAATGTANAFAVGGYQSGAEKTLVFHYGA